MTYVLVTPTVRDDIDIANTQIGIYRYIRSSRIQQTELLPEENLLSQIKQDDWLDMLDDDGQIEDEMFLRKVRHIHVIRGKVEG